MFQSVYRHELETKLSQKPWKKEIAKIPDWPRRKAVAEFRLCVGHDCLGTHLHRIAIRPDPYCMLCSLREPMDRNHLGQCTARFNRTECERYWEAWTEMMENSPHCMEPECSSSCSQEPATRTCPEPNKFISGLGVLFL